MKKKNGTTQHKITIVILIATRDDPFGIFLNAK